MLQIQVPVDRPQTADETQINHVPTEPKTRTFNLVLYRRKNEEFGIAVAPGTGIITEMDKGSPADRLACSQLEKLYSPRTLIDCHGI